jgi:DNA-directed RNA polymerase subunit RPC12/RpoP
MDQTKYLKGECAHCGGHIEFPALSAGTVADCPHCGQPTELLLARPKEEPAIPTKALVWTIIAAVVLILGLAGTLYALHLAKKQVVMKGGAPAATNAITKPLTETNALAKMGFTAGKVELEQAKGSSLVYAIGTLKNTENRERFGVKVELDLFDAGGKKIGEASDYQSVIETNGEWQFKAMVVDSKRTASGKIRDITETR